MKIKVLIVEDESLLALVYRKALERNNYEIIGIVGTGEEAIKKTEESHPNLVLMDIMLNGVMDGIETTMRIKEIFDVPVIYLTGNTDKQTRKRALETKPLFYIEKPVNSITLCKIIENCMPHIYG